MRDRCWLSDEARDSLDVHPRTKARQAATARTERVVRAGAYRSMMTFTASFAIHKDDANVVCVWSAGRPPMAVDNGEGL